MIKLRRVELERFAEVSAGLTVLLSQTPAWLNFLRVSQGSEPVLLKVTLHGAPAGFAVGGIVRRFGLRIFGSPLRGWTSSYMGLNLRPGAPRREALTELRRFAFAELGCAHVELLDRQAAMADYPRGFSGRILHGFELELQRPEDELFAGFESACRRAIRKAEKSGVVIEQADDVEAFAADYCSQQAEVFARQGLVPSYGPERVTQLAKYLGLGEGVLLLRARDAEGRSIATGVFPGNAAMMYFWGGASRREHQHLRPNEALMWHAIRWWRERGAAVFDMGGGGEYKAKYGGQPIEVPWMRASRSPALALLRSGAERAYGLRQRLLGRLKR